MSLFKLWCSKQREKITSQPAPLDPPPAPTAEEPRHNEFLVNQGKRAIQIILSHNGDDSICKGLGSLEMAKDMLKANFAQWSAREKPRIMVPGNGRAH